MHKFVTNSQYIDTPRFSYPKRNATMFFRVGQKNDRSGK